MPNLTWWEGGTCRFVGDVKYKRLGPRGYDNADLYQLLSYCIATGLPSGMLIYAGRDGDAEPPTRTVHRIGRSLQTFSLDVSVAPDDLLRQIGHLAARVRGMAAREPVA